MELSKRKKEIGLCCCAYRCKDKPVPKKGGLCHKHYARLLRKRDPVQVRYNQFRQNSKKRGIENTITIKQFREFCQRTGYIIRKGRRGQNATIDRMCNVHGYHIWNITLLTLSQNASKGAGSRQNCPF